MKAVITDISGIGPAAAGTLAEHGITSLRALARASVEKVSAVPGFSAARAAKVIAAAGELLGTGTPPAPAPEVVAEPESGGKEKKKKKKDKKKDKKKKKKGKGKK